MTPARTAAGRASVVVWVLVAAIVAGGCSGGDDHGATGAQEGYDVTRSFEPAPPKGEKPRVVILGASYAAGWQPRAFDGVEWINRGVGGEESTDMLARFESDVVALDPDVVILWGFINDIFRADRAKLDETKQEIRDAFTTMIDRAEEAGIRPVLATEITIRPEKGFGSFVGGILGSLRGKDSYQDFINGHVREVNDWVRATAEERGLVVLEFERLLGPDGSRDKRFAVDDGSHVSAAGYDAVDAHAAEHLAQAFGW